MSSFDPRDFRQALGMFATGVTIVTARGEDGSLVGMTANSFNSVSLQPPMVLWSLARTARSRPVFEQATHWNVHILSIEQESLSNRFARAGEDKFSGLSLDVGTTQAPLLPGCSARFQCKTAFCYDGGDHLILVGEVLAYDRSDKAPLLYLTGGYALAAPKAAQVASEAEAAERAQQVDAPYTEDLLGYLLGRAHYQLLETIRCALGEHKLGDAEFFVLSLLAVSPNMNATEIAQHMAYTGLEAGPTVLGVLEHRGLLASHRPSGNGATESSDIAGTSYRLTEQGQETMLRALAAAKAAEARLSDRLGEPGLAALRNLLKHAIASTDPGLPKLWRAAPPR